MSNQGVRKPLGLNREALAAIEEMEQQGYWVRQVKPPPDPWWVCKRNEGRFIEGYAERTPARLLRLANGAFAPPPQAYQQQVHEAKSEEAATDARA